MGRVRFQNQTPPATPPTGTTDVYVDQTLKHTMQIDDAGNIIDLTDGASPIADGQVLANISGSSNLATGVAVSALIDYTMGSAQGDILYRNASGWVVLTPGTSGQFLKTQGASANVVWANGNAGTVTSVGTGTGLTGGPITTSGTISLAAIANNTSLANISGGSAAPTPTTLTAFIDSAIGNTQGNLLYRNASSWVVLAPGTSGQFLQTAGAAANPLWANGNAGTVTSVATGTGLTGGTITTSGTISLAAIANNNLLANTSGGSAAPVATTLTGLIDSAIGNVQGDILYRNATGWVILAPGTSGQFLQTQGAAANPQWASGNAGTVTSVALSLPAIFTVSGSPVTTSGTLTGTLATQLANLVWAGPTSGGAATPTFRSLVVADIPVLAYVTSVALSAPAEFTVSGSPVTSSGTLTLTKATQTANTVWAGPTSGGAAAPTFRALVAADLPAIVGTGLKTKSGTVAAGSFSGSPKTATVTFGTAFASTAYSIQLTGADNRNFSWQTKATTGFTINANSATALTGNVDWIAIATGEST